MKLQLSLIAITLSLLAGCASNSGQGTAGDQVARAHYPTNSQQNPNVTAGKMISPVTQ